MRIQKDKNGDYIVPATLCHGVILMTLTAFIGLTVFFINWTKTDATNTAKIYTELEFIHGEIKTIKENITLIPRSDERIKHLEGWRKEHIDGHP